MTVVSHFKWLPRGTRRILSWIATAMAIAAVLTVDVVIAEFWSGISDSEIREAGWFAMGLGIVVTLALGLGNKKLTNPIDWRSTYA
jgi:hypothetical protein